MPAFRTPCHVRADRDEAAEGKNKELLRPPSRASRPGRAACASDALDLHVEGGQPRQATPSMENGIDQIAELNKNPAEPVDNPRANNKKVA
jgi:hypothetical protein